MTTTNNEISNSSKSQNSSTPPQPKSQINLKRRQKRPLFHQLDLIKLKIVADDRATVFMDGKLVLETSVFSVCSLNISNSFTVIAVQLSNIFGYIGFMAETSSGIVSDETWRCTNEKQTNEDWTRVHFNDRKWPRAVPYANNSPNLFLGGFRDDFPSDRLWISIAKKNHIGVIYCRKSR